MNALRKEQRVLSLEVDRLKEAVVELNAREFADEEETRRNGIEAESACEGLLTETVSFTVYRSIKQILGIFRILYIFPVY